MQEWSLAVWGPSSFLFILNGARAKISCVFSVFLLTAVADKIANPRFVGISQINLFYMNKRNLY